MPSSFALSFIASQPRTPMQGMDHIWAHRGAHPAQGQSPAQARPKPSPSPAQAWASPAQAWPKPDFWKVGNLEPGNLGIWDPPKIQKSKIIKIEIRVAQNVGKVWISTKKSSWPHLGPFQDFFFHGLEKCNTSAIFVYFPWWANGPSSPCLGRHLLRWLQ